MSQNQTSNYTEQGGARTVIGGALDVASGGEIDVESGGAFKLAGTAVTASAAELNQFDADAADGASLAFTDVQLTAAQVNALAATNITLVAAPGAGLAVVPVAVHLYLDFGSAAFVQTNGTDHLALRYAASNEIAEIGSEAQCTAFLEASADAALFHALSAGIVPEANKAVVLDNNGAAEYTTGTGSTVSIRTFYRVVPMAAFT